MISVFRRYRFFISVVLLHVIYFIAALHYGNICNGDTFEYVYEAVNIIELFSFYCGNPVLSLQEEYMTLRPPGYPLFVGMIYVFTINNFVVLFLQNIISVCSIFIARKVLMLLGYTSKLDMWFFLLLLLYPGQLVYANTIAPDVLLQICSVIYFYYTILFLKNKKTKSAFCMSLALITGLFMKPILYPFVVIHLFMILIYGGAIRAMSGKLAVSALLPLMCVLMYSCMNQIRTGKFHFSSIQSVNALYNHLSFYYDKEGFESGEKFITKERLELDKLPTFKERYDKANKRGIDLLKENFAPYIKYHLTKSGTFFLQTGRGELDQFMGSLTLSKIYTDESETLTTIVKEKRLTEMISYAKGNPTTILAFFTFLSNLLKLIGIFLFLKYTQVTSVIKWFIALYILYFALITGPVSNAHYVMPVSLIMMCCAVTGYLYMFQKLHFKKTA